MADRDKDALGRQYAFLVSFVVQQPNAFNARVFGAVDLEHLGIPQDLDLAVRQNAILHDGRSPELAAAVNERHLGRELGQEQRLFHSGVAAADDYDRPVAKKESVTCRTCRDAVAAQALGHGSLARNAEPFS